MNSTSEIIISKSALANNIDFIKHQIGENCQLSSVIKGNAYGHGIELFVPMAEDCGVNHFSVFSTNEAQRALNASKGKSTFMIMGVCDYGGEMEWVIDNEVEFFVYDIHRLTKAIKYAKKLNKKARIHIELETGMNRTGFQFNELDFLKNTLMANLEHIELVGLCTHFAGAESIANYFRVKNQILAYQKAEKWFTRNGITFKQHHLACSAGVMNYPKTIRSLVRVGIMQYGFWSNRETQMRYVTKKENDLNPLRRLISWKSYVMGVKFVNAGEFIGYGTSLLAEQKMQVITVPVGYSHGFSRSLSNQGKVIVRGQRLDVIGVVNMNMMIVDATNLEAVEKGDEVVLIGSMGANAISVDAFGELSSQLNYELLTRLPLDTPRRVVF
jgi:alanine racemase